MIFALEPQSDPQSDQQSDPQSDPRGDPRSDPRRQGTKLSATKVTLKRGSLFFELLGFLREDN